MATAAKFQTDVQAMEMDAVQQKLCLDVIAPVKEPWRSRFKKNDLKHQIILWKTLRLHECDEWSLRNGSRVKIDRRVHEQEDSVQQKSCDSLVVQGDSCPLHSRETCANWNTEVLCELMKGTRSRFPSPLRITSDGFQLCKVSGTPLRPERVWEYHVSRCCDLERCAHQIESRTRERFQRPKACVHQHKER